MSMYAVGPDSPMPNGTVDSLPPAPQANQACMTCRKQKRKCNKALPACALCERMNRHCDYSDSTPPPTSEDFNALRMKLMELESRLNEGGGGGGGGGAMSSPPPFTTPSSGALPGSEALGPQLPYTPQQQEAPTQWHGVQNRFPAIVFLDKKSFTHGGINIPKPSIEIPVDVLDLLGNGQTVQAIVSEYFATVHRWMPIVSQMRMTRNMVNPIWEAGPDLALLFLCMKLIISRPQDGIESSQNPIYLAAKRFISLLEMSGAATLLILQANLLVMWYEYGQAIYPAAWMTAGWCVRYGNLLGINGQSEAVQILGRPNTWTEKEERHRTWWGVQIADRVVSNISQGYIMNSQEPDAETVLPVDDAAWDEGEMSAAAQTLSSAPIDVPVAPFPRLCQASSMMGKVLHHHHAENVPTETARFELASQLYLDVSALARKITEEIATIPDYMTLTAPLSLTFSALATLCEPYSSPTSYGSKTASAEGANMQIQAVDGLKTVSRSILDFSEQINAVTSEPQDLDRISPMVMAPLYAAAANFAWLVQESGDENSQMALDALRRTLSRLGTRWRNAAEYARILEAQEFQYAVGSAGS
ncbi:Depudecin biosynthesis cluster-specific transcription activator [Lachnellula willkommii]|uniref:Depudecin biosynthesis cluster-specific transcription activator n=1 Tax=Lachnellula willkommii TaxID=215461 RepID=A0A559MAR8_9HELO|nr:Depudecin biosynthesis cluster-specific transcription activator [Lachnellula willkommii]